MKYLIDSHILVWSVTRSHKLNQTELKVLQDSDNEIFFSPASIIELGIKSSKGKLSLPHDFTEAALQTGFKPLSITLEHSQTETKLPRHHADPFDRIIAAQAKTNQLTLITRDALLHQYPIQIL